MHGVPPPPNRFRAARLYERNAMDFVDLHLAVRFGSAAKERGGAGGAGFWHPVWGKAGGPKPGAAGPRQPQQPQQQQHQQQQPEAPGGEGRADGASPAPGVGGAEGGPAAPTAGPEATGEHPQPAVDGQPGNDEAEPPAVSWASPERTSVVEPPADDAAADVDDPQSSDEPEESEQTPETEGSHDSNEELPKVVLLKDNAVEDRYLSRRVLRLSGRIDCLLPERAWAKREPLTVRPAYVFHHARFRGGGFGDGSELAKAPREFRRRRGAGPVPRVIKRKLPAAADHVLGGAGGAADGEAKRSVFRCAPLSRGPKKYAKFTLPAAEPQLRPHAFSMLEAQFLEATYGHHYVLIDDIVNGSIHVSLGGNVLNADAVERSPVAYDGYLTTVEAIALAFPHVSTHNLQRLFNTTSRFHDTPIIFHKFPPVVTDEMLAIFNQLDRPQQSYLTPAILKKALPDFTEEEIEHHIADACKASSRGRGIVPKSSVLCFTAFCELVKHAYRPFFGLLDFQR